MQIPVYLTDNVVRDRWGRPHRFPQQCLARQTADDRVIAVVEAPAGARVRRRPDVHGPDQLLVPAAPGFWARRFGHKHVIPAKYVVHEARLGLHGLALVEPRRQTTVRCAPSDVPTVTGLRAGP